MPKRKNQRFRRSYPDADACAYPYLYESSRVVDFELLMDEVACHVGMVYAHLRRHESHRETFAALAELAWHVNGSVRGDNAVTARDVAFVRKTLRAFRAAATETLRDDRFYLPVGDVAVAWCEIVRCGFKKAARAAYLLQKEDRSVRIGQNVFDVLNLSSNLFHYVGLYLRACALGDAREFVSKSYPSRGPGRAGPRTRTKR